MAKITELAKMFGWIVKYHRYLVSSAESMEPNDRWMSMRGYFLPWVIPLFLGIIFGIIFQPDELHRLIMAISIGIISLGGMMYVSYVFIYYGIRFDRRAKEAKVEKEKAIE